MRGDRRSGRGRQQARHAGRRPARDRMERRRRLRDGRAGPAGELLTYRLDDLPLPRDRLQCLGDGFTQLGQFAIAARTGCRTRDDHALARQMRWERCPHRFGAGEAAHGIPELGLPGVGRGGICLQLFKLKFQLIEPAAALRRWAKAVALVFGDHQLQGRDHRFRSRDRRFRHVPGRPLRRQGAAQRIEVVRDGIGRRRHVRSESYSVGFVYWFRAATKLYWPYPAARSVVDFANRSRPTYSRAGTQKSPRTHRRVMAKEETGLAPTAWHRATCRGHRTKGF
jgi:hypothetical protein